jgi:hypothetical protein
MDDEKCAQMKQWVETWKQAGIELERLRREELPLVSTMQALLNLSDAFESCRLHFPPRPSSGLVEQQAWFQKYRTLHKKV